VKPIPELVGVCSRYFLLTRSPQSVAAAVSVARFRLWEIALADCLVARIHIRHLRCYDAATSTNYRIDAAAVDCVHGVVVVGWCRDGRELTSAGGSEKSGHVQSSAACAHIHRHCCTQQQKIVNLVSGLSGVVVDHQTRAMRTVKTYSIPC
jgi:hypothetical protein